VIITSRNLAYYDLNTALTGLLYWNPEQVESAPGILLIHGGAGLDEHARDQALRYAELGYTVLACDMYGPGVAGDRERVLECVRALRDDPALLRRRAAAGLAALVDSPEAGGGHAAIGFCFGGMTALELARSGANLAAAVSIHGSLGSKAPARPGALTAKVLVCHGASDPHVPTAEVTTFADEMDHAGADWQLIMYGGAVHGFTHAHAAPGAMTGVAYDRSADQRSFNATTAFLAEAI